MLVNVNAWPNVEVCLGVISIVESRFWADSGREGQMDMVILDFVPHGNILDIATSLKCVPLEVLHNVFSFDFPAVPSGDKPSSLILD